MANNELKIIIGGSVDPTLSASAKEAAKSLGDVSKAATQVNNIKIVNNYGRSLQETGKGATAAATGVKNLKSASDSAIPVLTDFGRVIQDFPFGFVSIQNNITQLPDSFRRLKEATGSTGGALKALLGSLTGPGGIGIALSLVTSAVTIASIGFGAWTRGLTGSGNAAKKAKDETSDYEKVLKSTAQTLADDFAKATTLINALLSGTLNTEQRKKALQDLQNINVEFFGSLKDEKTLVNDLEKAYDSYLAKVLQIGRAKAIEAQLARLFDKKITLELAIDPKFLAATNEVNQKIIGDLKKELDSLGGPINDQTKAYEDFNKELAKSGKILQPGEKLQDKAQENIQRRLNLQFRINELQQGYNFFQDANYKATVREIGAIDRQIKGLSELQKIAGNFDISAATKSKTGEDDSLKELRKELAGYQRQLEDVNKLREAGALPLFRENDALALQLKIFETLNKIDAREVTLKLKPALEIDPVIDELQVKQAIKEFILRSGTSIEVPLIINPKATFDVAGATLPTGEIAENYADSFTKQFNRSVGDKLSVDFGPQLAQAATEGISAFATAIGEAITGNTGLQEVFAGLFQTIANGLQDFGKALIAYGIAAQAFKLAIKNPIAAIAAGAGLIIAGSVLKNAIPKFADGGIATGPTLGIFGEAGTEAIIPLDRLPDLIDRINPRVANNRFDNREVRVALQPSVKFSGDSFQVMLNRVNKSKGQLG